MAGSFLSALHPNKPRKSRNKCGTRGQGRYLLQRLTVAPLFLLTFYLFTRIPWHVRLYPADTSSVTLSLVIPATFEDFRCFSQQLMQRISESSVLPDEVVMVVSGVPRGYHSDPLHIPDVQLLVEYRAESHNQAENKNRGAQIASGDVIQFFDIDDVLHPWAIHAIKRSHIEHGSRADAIMFSHQHFSDKYKAKRGGLNPPTCTVHPRTHCTSIWKRERKLGSNSPFAPFCVTAPVPCANMSSFPSSLLYESCFQEHVFRLMTVGDDVHWCCLTDHRPNFAAGWLSVRRTVAVKQVFNQHFSIAEDGEYIGRLLTQGYKVQYFDIPIGYYNQDHTNPSCSREWF